MTVHSQSQIPHWVKDYYSDFYDSITSKENWCYTVLISAPAPTPWVPPPPDPIPNPLPPHWVPPPVPTEPPGYVDPGTGAPMNQPGLYWLKPQFKKLATAMDLWKAHDFQATVMDMTLLASSFYGSAALFNVIDLPNPNGLSAADILKKSDAYVLYNMGDYMPATLARNLPLLPGTTNGVLGTPPTNVVGDPNHIPPILESHTMGNPIRTEPDRGDDYYNDMNDKGHSALLTTDVGIVSNGGVRDDAKAIAMKTTFYAALKSLGAKGSFEIPTGTMPDNAAKTTQVFSKMHYAKVYANLNISSILPNTVPL